MRLAKFLLAGILVAATFVVPASAEEGRQTYAQDKLANAQAQLERLKMQKKAINELIVAVKKDLRAAKIRARAERLQIKADTQKQDAGVMISQTGLAVDLPNLLDKKGVAADLASQRDLQDESVDELFRRTEDQQEAVFFPGGSSNIRSDEDINNYLNK